MTPQPGGYDCAAGDSDDSTYPRCIRSSPPALRLSTSSFLHLLVLDRLNPRRTNYFYPERIGLPPLRSEKRRA
jgi:hypothetical protein